MWLSWLGFVSCTKGLSVPSQGTCLVGMAQLLNGTAQVWSPAQLHSSCVSWESSVFFRNHHKVLSHCNIVRIIWDNLVHTMCSVNGSIFFSLPFFISKKCGLFCCLHYHLSCICACCFSDCSQKSFFVFFSLADPALFQLWFKSKKKNFFFSNAFSDTNLEKYYSSISDIF